MADFPGFDELFRIFVTEAVYRANLAGRMEINADTFNTQGTDANLLAAGCAGIGAEIIRQVVLTDRDRMLSTATGEALDRWIFDHYVDPYTLKGMRRKDAASALVRLTLSRSAPGAAGIIAVGQRFATPGTPAIPQGVEFAILDNANFAGDTLAVSVDAIAVQAGLSGNVAAGTITLPRAPPFDTTITVTNATAATGGSERETDDTFRQRARDFWRALRRGTLQAIEYGATTVDGIASALASEMPLLDPSTGLEVARWTTLAVADGAGNANATLVAAVDSALDEFRPCGVYVQTIGATAKLVNWVLTMGFIAGTDTVAAKARIAAAIVAMTNSLRAGETLHPGAGYDIARRDIAAAPGSVVVVAPAGPVVPLVSGSVVEILRTTHANVRIN